MKKQISFIFAGIALLVASAVAVPAQENMKMKEMPYDLHFIDTMMMHHHHGIDMAKLVDERSANPRVKGFAAKTIAAENKGLEDLRELRDRWYADQPVMDMSQKHHMPGMEMDMKMDMDMDDSMAKLRAAKGPAFDRLFLDLMIHHHQMALKMSKEAVTKAEHVEIKDLARRGVVQQQADIAEMKKLAGPAPRTTAKPKPKPKTMTHKH